MKRLSAVARPLVACLLLLLGAASSPSRALVHPHGPDSEVYFTGTIKRVDADARTLVIDAVDPRSLSRRDLLAHVDAGATIRRGRQNIALTDIEPGVRASCAGFREQDEGDRIVLTDVRINGKRR